VWLAGDLQVQVQDHESDAVARSPVGGDWRRACAHILLPAKPRSFHGDSSEGSGPQTQGSTGDITAELGQSGGRVARQLHGGKSQGRDRVQEKRHRVRQERGDEGNSRTFPEAAENSVWENSEEQQDAQAGQEQGAAGPVLPDTGDVQQPPHWTQRLRQNSAAATVRVRGGWLQSL